MRTQGPNIDAQVQALKPGWQSAIPIIGGILYSKFGIEGEISSGARTPEHNAEVNGSPTSHHIDSGNGGDALDIVLPRGTSAAKADEIREYFEQSGDFSEVLYHNAGSGYHLHLGGLKRSLSAGGPMQYEEVEVSAYNEKIYNAAYKALIRQAGVIKMGHDDNLQNAINALIPAAKGMEYISQVEELVRSNYPNMTPTDINTVIKAVASATVSDTRSDEGYRHQQEYREAEQASKDFYAWRLLNPDASSADILEAAKAYGLNPKEQYAIQNSLGIGGSLKDAYAWGKNSDNEKTFNDVCGSLKLTGMEKSYVREKLNKESERRQEAGEAPLDLADVRAFVQNEASGLTINKNMLPFSGQNIKRADVPYNWTVTEYGVLDPNGNTMRYNMETQEWEVMNS
ncbi:D-Ala-D-Ala carboxypeptidase family metallohydrolase [Selenomonas sp. TAMA-11512]|uniref:D-Ala-D-Ala carboxypeptidase family metallohydrolase n=1 Tax=Selenomonas sp. TAMA-11512 TaxID=3095337 RepID=UPI0030D469DE